MNNCHNCKRMTGKTRVQYRCDGAWGWVNEDVLGEECEGFDAKEKEAVQVEQSCNTCKWRHVIFKGEPCNNGCVSRSKWQPKEDNWWEKDYTRQGMTKMLLDYPHRIAICVKDKAGADGHNRRATLRSGLIRWNDNANDYENAVDICVEDDKSQWRIIEPEPEQVEFWQAFKEYFEGANRVKSIVTGRVFDNNNNLVMATEEELKGKWIILN